MAAYKSCLVLWRYLHEIGKGGAWTYGGLGWRKVKIESNREKDWEVMIYKYRKKTKIKREKNRKWTTEQTKKIHNW